MIRNFKITSEKTFLRAVLSPCVEPSSTMHEFFTDLPKTARDRGFTKILCDFSCLRIPLSTIERFDYACLVAEKFRGLQIAFILNECMRDPDLFGETVAVNRGGVVCVFTTLSEAYRWLRVTPDYRSRDALGPKTTEQYLLKNSPDVQ